MGDTAVEDPGKERLLPGEATSIHSGDLEDARLWARVYAELSGFKDALLAEVEEQRGIVEQAGQPEVDNDTRLLQREADRLQRRLRFWEQEVFQRQSEAAG